MRSARTVVAQEQRDLAKGALIAGAGILARTSKALYFILLTRLFGREVFGVYLLAYAVCEIVSKIAALGLDYAAMRFAVQLQAQGRDGDVSATISRVLRIAFVSSLFVAGALVFFADRVAEGILRKSDLRDPISRMAVIVPVLALLNILMYTARAARKIQYEVYVRSVIEPLLLLGAGVGIYFVKPDITGVVLSQVIGSSCALTVAFFLCRGLFPARAAAGRGRPTPVRELLAYGLPMGAMDLLNNFKQRLDILMVGRFLSPGHVAVFGAVTEIGNLMRKVRQSFEPTFMPIVTFLHERKDFAGLRRHLVVAIRWMMFVCLMLFLPMIFAGDVYLWVFGPQFVGGWGPLAIFGAGILFYSLYGTTEYLLSMTGYAYATLFNSILLVGINFSLALVLIPHFGLVGAAAASAAALVGAGGMYILAVRRRLALQPFDRSHLKPVAAGAAALAASVGLRFLLNGGPLETLGLVVPAFLFLYGFLLKTFGFEEEDLEMLGRLRLRFRGWISRVTRREASRR